MKKQFNRGTCPVCGASMPLNEDGTIVTHSGPPYIHQCEGSYQKPEKKQ